MSSQSNDRRTGTRKLIKQLVQERQRVLVLFCQVAGLEPYTCRKPVRDMLEEFCQVLVDYIARGHFEFYDRICNGEERRREVAALAMKLYPRLAQTTEKAVAFNDKYADIECECLDELSRDLSELGEQLATRIELEDQIIGRMLWRAVSETRLYNA